MRAWPDQTVRIQDRPEKRLGRRGGRDAIDWIDAVQQLEGSICPHRFSSAIVCPDSDRHAGARDLQRGLGI